MSFLMYAIGCPISWIIGLFMFAQIAGSIEYIKVRPIKSTIKTMLFASIVLLLTVLAIIYWFSAYKTVFLIALSIGCLMSCRHQEI